MSGAWTDRLEMHPRPLCYPKSPGVHGPEVSPGAGGYYLVPVQLAGYVLVLQPVADRASVRTRCRIAASEPLLYQRLHLFMSELVPKLYRRVTRYCGQDPLFSAHPRGCTPHGGNRLPETSRHITALCQGRDHSVYPEGVLAEWLHLKAVDRKLFEGIARLRSILGRE